MNTIGILGAGAMGGGIALTAATAGQPVVIYDLAPEASEKCHAYLEKTLQSQVEKQKIDRPEADQILQRIRLTNQIDDLAPAVMVIEAIVENLEIKQAAFKNLEAIVDTNAILASNTSSLSISAIGAHLQYPERVVGIHFFNPAHLMRLVEIVPAVQTARQVAQTAFEMVKSWKKTPVFAQDTPGFIVNRVARPFYGEALRLLEEGIADAPTIDWAMREIGGFKMGPFELMDFIGHDVNYIVTETIFKSFYYDPRYRPSFTQKRLFDARYFGRKSGRGFYDYRQGALQPEAVKDMALGQNILRRILVMLINEAADALYLRIATRDDIDLAMTLGVNYPKGLLAWADETGIAEVVDTLDALHAEYLEDRYRCSPLLRKMLRENTTFYPANPVNPT